MADGIKGTSDLSLGELARRAHKAIDTATHGKTGLPSAFFDEGQLSSGVVLKSDIIAAEKVLDNLKREFVAINSAIDMGSTTGLRVSDDGYLKVHRQKLIAAIDVTDELVGAMKANTGLTFANVQHAAPLRVLAAIFD